MPPDVSDALESSPDVVVNKTNDLLDGILTELQNIGRQLQQQDVRLGAVERQVGEGVKDGQGIVEVTSHQFRPTSLRALWRPVLADIESAGPNRHTIQNALHIYTNDLVGIDQLDHEDRLFPDIPVRKATMEEERDWTQLVGNIWRLPEDGRLALRFQKRCLIQPFQNGPRIPSDPLIATSYLHQLAFDELQVPKRVGWRLQSELSRSNISITDYFGGGLPPTNYDINAMGYFGPTNEGLQARGVKSRGSRMCTFGPWRRIISIHALEYRTLSLMRLTKALQPHHIEQAIEDYQQCRRRLREHRWVEWDAGCVRFHVTFYQIRQVSDYDEKYATHTSFWKRGHLHSDQNQRLLCESAYTALLIPNHDRGLESPRDYWTLLELRPQGFLCLTNSIVGTLSENTDVLLVALAVADKAMMKIYLHWRDIIEYFDSLISEKDTFLDPERHDNLLSDDESFSRSKKYFWAITTLKELDASVSDNLLQVRRLLDSAAPSSIEKLHRAEFEDARYCLKIRYHELEEVATKLREKRQEATDLRDGLFSASAVMESRAATRLGENVKLLTFVSIFFLPLSFCMSLWSINTLFSLNALAIVTPIVAISTYFVVFNIDSIAHLFRFIYGSVLYNTISSMKRDESDTWKERGKAFERYSSLQRPHNKPSDWRLVQYAIMRPWSLFAGQSKPSNKVEPMESNTDFEKSGLESEGTGLSSLSPSLRLWKRRTMGNQTVVP